VEPAPTSAWIGARPLPGGAALTVGGAL
jgi:hypothetical protein